MVLFVLFMGMKFLSLVVGCFLLNLIVISLCFLVRSNKLLMGER